MITPSKIDNSTDWKLVPAGGLFSLAMKTGNTIWSWGYNVHGQLGDGTNSNQYIPAKVDNTNNWQSISAGNYRTFSLKMDSTLWGWGDNTSGAWGDGTTTDRNVPVQTLCANPLPIVLTAFTLKKQQSAVLLNWQTATELNNKEY